MPGTYFGPYGAQYANQAEPAGGNCGRFPLGTKLILPDQREYRYALAGGTAPVAASLYQSVAPVANHTNIAVDVARAIGATAISATLGATAAAIDIYSEGMDHINDATGEGYGHRIKRAQAAGDAHAAAAASAVLTVNLTAGETVQVALVASTSEVSFTRNRFHAVIIHASPPTAGLAGVSPIAGTGDYYFYAQTKGYAAVLADGTLLVGNPVQASITTDGAVEGAKIRITMGATAAADSTAGTLATDQDGAETAVRIMGAAASTSYDITGGIAKRAPLVGICVKVNATTEQALIDLCYLD